MSVPTSALRRKSQVFVQIPPSPHSHAKPAKTDRPVLPESTPLKSVAMNVDNHPSPSSSTGSVVHLKRKAHEETSDMKQTDESNPPRAKKHKTGKVPATGEDADQPQDASNAGEPQGRCHQCTRHFPEALVIRCTARRRGDRCLLRYCKACLHNRYQQSIDDHRAVSPDDAPLAQRALHVGGVDYLFRCPRCSDSCNCRFCRKAKGLPATGNLNLAARRASQGTNDVDGTSASVKRSKAKTSAKPKPAAKRKDSTQVNTPSLKCKPHVLVPPSPYKIKASGAPAVKKPRKVKEKPVAPPRPVPKPIWTPLETLLTLDDALVRMNIREFLLRFAHLADIARTRLEELEELVRDDPYTAMADEDEEVDEPLLVGWISETALRAILVGLVSLFLKDADAKNEDTSAFSKASQQLRNSGANLNKVWSALAPLREQTELVFPDPLPVPASSLQRSTRSAARDALTVVSTSQFVPVVAALVEAAHNTKPVQDDFERAATQEKDLARAARELSATENARYKEVKAAKATSKVKKPLAVRRAAAAAHEAQLVHIECAHGVAAAECIPRFNPLGRDTEGRVYYALTPGVTEREAAVELLEGGKGDVRFGRRRVADLEERKALKHWSWFVTIWGRKPDGADVAKLDDEDDTRDGDEDEGEHDSERWWVFWEPAEIRKLAEWLAMKHGINIWAKRIAKDSADSTVLDADDTSEKDKEGDKKPRGRPSNASSVPSTSRARTFTSSHDSDSNSEDELSELSDMESDDEDDDRDEDEDGNVQMRLDARGEPVPTRHDLRTLALGLKEYGQTLEWRIKRATKDDADSEKNEETGNAADETQDKVKGKGKAVAKPHEPIPPSRFYGK